MANNKIIIVVENGVVSEVLSNNEILDLDVHVLDKDCTEHDFENGIGVELKDGTFCEFGSIYVDVNKDIFEDLKDKL